MKEEVLKNISVSVSNECWKKIKIMSIQREISLLEQVREMLERAVQNKKFSNDVHEE